MKLKTTRLIIRSFKDSDLELLIHNLNDLEVSKHVLLMPYPYTRKDGIWWIKHSKDTAKKKERANYDLAIQLSSEKGIIGGIGFSHVDKFQGTAEIGYWLGRTYHRNGYMSEAMSAMLKFAFKKLKLRRINLHAYTDNEASNNLAKKFGFVYEGTERQAARSKANGVVHDLNIYGLLKEDYLKNKA